MNFSKQIAGKKLPVAAIKDSNMVDAHISLRNVQKKYGKAIAIENLDLEIEEGKFSAIMGPSGCGKSTLLRCLAGLEAPTSGDIFKEGHRINDLPIWERETPLVWQSLALFPFLSVRENVEFGLRMKGIKSKEKNARTAAWLDRLGLAQFSERGVDQLSGGQRQRVALARCLVTEPSVLLLDEPLSALDAHLSIQMQGELKRLQRELGITFIYVTHSHSEAFSMADKVVIMNDGHIEQTGSPEEIYLRPKTPFVARFLGGSSIFQCTAKTQKNGDMVLEAAEGTFRCISTEALSLQDGQSGNLMVRADQISITAEGGWAANEVRCTVVGEEFIGALINVRLETETGTPIIVQQQQRDMESLDIEVGSRVTASWHPEDGYVIND